MSQLPELLTNDQNYSVAGGINAVLNHLRQSAGGEATVAIATAYVNSAGFQTVAKQLTNIPRVRLLLGVEPDVAKSKIRQLKQAPTNRNEQRLSDALEGHVNTLQEDRNLLGFEYEVDRAARDFVNWLRSGKVEVRRYEKGFLHGKAWIASNGSSSVIAGSANFTYAGLKDNRELNFGLYQPSMVTQVGEWYEKLWCDATDYDLAALYSARYQEYSPYLIYLRMLWERYGQKLPADDSKPRVRLNLTSFQRDGLLHAQRILEQYDGVLVADGVGLGKSFIAGELMEEAIMKRGQRVLLVAPATLRDGIWKTFQDRMQGHFKCISYEQLRDNEQLKHNREPSEPHLDIRRYSMIVIDEAHGFRNPEADRATALRKLFQSDPDKKLVMLTATPISNTVWDLYHLLNYFLPNDATFAAQGIKSLRKHFKRIANMNTDQLEPNLLFDILDEVAVRRTRHFIKRYYLNDTIKLNDRTVKIEFPKPNVIKVDYNLDAVLPGFFGRLKQALDAECRAEQTFRIPASQVGKTLSLARYITSSYLKTPRQDSREVQISGLLLSGLLKRFESSSKAFANTCGRMAQNNRRFLEALKRGNVLTGDDLKEWVATDSDDIDTLIEGFDTNLSADNYNADQLWRDVEADIKLLEAFSARADKVAANQDPKLERLYKELGLIAQQFRGDSNGERNRRKVLIFTYYKDTANWIHEYLIEKIKTEPQLALYKNRIAVTTGSSNSGTNPVNGFAPVSTESGGADKYDLLIATDVLSEGTNLQQACHIINYDLPWNPMRLVQRHGRIDRIGSEHKEVFLRCFFPDHQLDEILQLEERLRTKLKVAAIGVGVESEVLPGSEISDVNFNETISQLHKIRNEDATLFKQAGETRNRFSGEEYRHHLREGLRQDPELLKQIRELAWGSGSGLAVPANDSAPGYVFCVRVGNHESVQFRFVSYHNPQKPTVESSMLECLSRAHCEPETARTLDEATRKRAYEAWALAKQDIYATWQAGCDPRTFSPKVPKAMRDAATLVRKHKPTGKGQDAVDELLNILEADHGERVHRQFREIVKQNISDRSKSALIDDLVNNLGLTSCEALKPLPLIDEQDIHLICWLALV